MSSSTAKILASNIKPNEKEETNEIRSYKLEKGEELRFEVENETVNCKLIEGHAELYGTELRLEQQYSFQKGAKVAIFTFHGCELKLSGKSDVEYVAKETPMTLYINLANALEGLRATATKNDDYGPNVLIAGPMDVGKSTFSRILLNYAVRFDRKPIFVDLDLGQGSVSIPGNIGAVVIEKPADVVESFQINAPIVFHYGHTSHSKNPKLYDIIMGALAETVEKKKQNDSITKYSGTIVNTSGWVQGYGYQSILQAIQHFKINIILVLDQERLYSELVRDLKSSSNVRAFLIPKSGGVVSRSREFRAEMRDNRIRNYFYGTSAKPLYPFSIDIPFNQFTAYKVGSPNLPDSCLPIGMKSSDNSTKLMPITPSSSIDHHIFSILSLQDNQELDSLITTNILGFVAVSNVNMERQIVTLLSPQPKPLPKNSVFILSEVQFVDLE
ncbi:Protein CLP1 -like protein [Sarcoptes scabiei]|uniref:Protein CLP1 homolog n=1 Tax=Sarcoptes scabiei TaxID=52283 RepID=A0A834R344_SARSC|nr:Protein CLP1 -like protein [Sarcoptes scabiei]UXI18327.1 uncharacterized protein NH340_JMT04270 [Sarcoptes scabiei]